MSSTSQRRSRLGLQHGYCIGVSRRSAQATVSKGLAQGPYAAARARVEPTTLRLRLIDLTNAPPRPTFPIIQTYYTTIIVFVYSRILTCNRPRGVTFWS